MSQKDQVERSPKANAKVTKETWVSEHAEMSTKIQVSKCKKENEIFLVVLLLSSSGFPRYHIFNMESGLRSGNLEFALTCVSSVLGASAVEFDLIASPLSFCCGPSLEIVGCCICEISGCVSGCAA